MKTLRNLVSLTVIATAVMQLLILSTGCAARFERGSWEINPNEFHAPILANTATNVNAQGSD